jgi:hypothetical protein
VIIGKHLRITMVGALAALAVAVPGAQAKQVAGLNSSVHVCNQATHQSVGGDFVATDGDTGPSARYQGSLKPKPGNGGGLVDAAAKSPALSHCELPGGESPVEGGGTILS